MINFDIKYRLINDDNDFNKLSILYIDSWKRTYNGLIPDEFLNQLTYEYAKQKFIDYLNIPSAFIYVAIAIDDNNEEVICGMAVSQLDEEPETGLLYSLHVDPKYKGKGIGKELIKKTAIHFKTVLNINSLLLWAVKGNDNAITIYKHLGATIHKYQTEFYSNQPINEICLIWKDLNILINK